MDVAPGETTRLTLGGTGRPIVGKAVVPAELAGRNDWLFSSGYLIGKASAFEAGPGRSRPDRESYTFKVEPDGTFRIEDIAAGTYEILIILNKRPVNEGGLGHEPLASIRREVVVPPIPGGRSDEPLDLGAIPLVAVEKPNPAPGTAKP